MFTPHPEVKIHVLPGGKMPRRQRRDDIGYDACIRAVVSASEMDAKNSKLRKTLFDFEKMPADPRLRSKILELPCEDGTRERELVYRMEPRETITVGIGVVTELPPGLGLFLMPRSGLASRWKIVVANAPGTVDPGYRGEAGSIIMNLDEHESFDLRHGYRIVQLIFQWVVFPNFTLVDSYKDLSSSERDAEGFGSTGLGS